MINRLVFGCGRLTGGATRREAMGLLEICLDAGIRQFDAAPSYGLGTAEALVGKVARGGLHEIAVTTKVGSTAPPHGYAKTWLRRLKRGLTAGRPRLDGSFTPVNYRDVSSSAEFQLDTMRRSVDRSLRYLGSIDRLLLHEALPSNVDSEIFDELARLATMCAATPGYSNGAQFDVSCDAAFPAGWVSQTAVAQNWFVSPPADMPRPAVTLHSIALTGQWLAATQPRFANAVSAGIKVLGGGSGQTAIVATYFAIVAAHLPTARLIVASSDPSRLRALLAVLAGLDEQICKEIAGTVRGAA